MSDTAIVLTRTTQDVLHETRSAARYVGDLNDQTFRVDLSSALGRRDREDHFRFRVVSSEAFVRLYSIVQAVRNGDTKEEVGEDQVRIQLFNNAGRVIADSDKEAGEAYQRYQELLSGTNVRLSRGAYVLRLSRTATADSDAEYAYNLVLRGNWQPLADGAVDTALRVFSTEERPASTAAFQTARLPVFLPVIGSVFDRRA